MKRHLHKRGRSIPGYRFKGSLTGFYDDVRRKNAEKELCSQARRSVQRQVEDWEILIDVPDAKRTIETTQLKRILVHYREGELPRRQRNPSPFTDKFVSILPRSILQSFVKNVRRIRVICSEDLVDFVRVTATNKRLKELIGIN
ncbi:hypothetical protein FJY68_03970 [candidate division WOR-3 bacterium]|uniref:Uncharacterized protein n=1 Tax=candidate division WOR-3 bacterium TaxID=2052148 RepID=A0A937XCP9_UNCW3|nr:hypothetical protein [candidate division WOR-3 bacterium]